MTMGYFLKIDPETIATIDTWATVTAVFLYALAAWIQNMNWKPFKRRE
jgi:hypothetical protein